MKNIQVTCPTCKKKFNYYTSEFRPFCTERCRLIDLGQWLDESYTVPVQKLTEDEALTLEHLIHEKNQDGESESE
ncbi:MAG TPA: DNA gyrase inhibitor YacG [Bacteriovoracaceae bacterium]|nr:DNA gyrase inhibitor YacG [Bacteriovoracaceae bacterium]